MNAFRSGQGHCRIAIASREEIRQGGLILGERLLAHPASARGPSLLPRSARSGSISGVLGGISIVTMVTDGGSAAWTVAKTTLKQLLSPA